MIRTEQVLDDISGTLEISSDSEKSTNQLLIEILFELKKLNLYMSVSTDTEISDDDVS